MLSRVIRTTSKLQSAGLRAYSVTVGNTKSLTKGNWKTWFKMTADHGDELYMLVVMVSGVVLLCFWHCAWDNCWSKPEINSIFPIDLDTACRRHSTDIDWNSSTAQRRFGKIQYTVHSIINNSK